eukprot:scaffold65679_cov21-Tisochrysis_lutea.AAC.1
MHARTHASTGRATTACFPLRPRTTTSTTLRGCTTFGYSKSRPPGEDGTQAAQAVYGMPLNSEVAKAPPACPD